MHNTKNILLFLLIFLLQGTLAATPIGIYKAETNAALDKTYKAIYQALEAKNFWVVFEVNITSSISRFADKWGDEYNQNKLEGIRSLVVCNGWYANQVSNADPDLMALCPLRIGLTHKAGKTQVLFARPSLAAAGSPGLPLIQEIENIIIAAIDNGIKASND